MTPDSHTTRLAYTPNLENSLFDEVHEGHRSLEVILTLYAFHVRDGCYFSQEYRASVIIPNAPLLRLVDDICISREPFAIHP
jgi:hypothetical protein